MAGLVTLTRIIFLGADDWNGVHRRTSLYHAAFPLAKLVR